MSVIRLLSPELISQIAAGEVVERPASALKELVENSLDSGTSSISVEIEGGGLQKIRVVDRGSGMSFEDAALAFTAHATSKIATVEDLFSLASLGFRGEALASIASIAHVLLKTRPVGERMGTALELDAGKLLRHEETACSEGTEITITGLFHPTPARRKYMKSEATEYGHCFDILSELAMAHPNVGFRLLKDGELVFDLPSGQTLHERIRVLYGGQTADALVPVTYEQSNVILRGFVGKPELSRSSRKYQFLFVNGHPIQNRLVGHAVQEAFHSLLMNDKFPWYVLELTMDPAFVDVNVHPRKLEVKFVNTQEIYRIVFGAVKHALEHATLSPLLGRVAAVATSGSSPDKSTESLSFLSFDGSEERPEKSVASLEREHRFIEVKTLQLRPLTQVYNRYIVAESPEGLVLIDQHAAHERVRYERLMKTVDSHASYSQALLTPLQLDLGVESAQLLREHAAAFAELGYEIEEFGGNTFLIRAVPLGLEKRDPEAVLKEVLADVTKEWKQNHVKNVREVLATVTACRGAIKFGDALNMLEMEALIKDMAVTPNCTHCPHGRPALFTWTHEKLEELFKRRNF
ncbi:DNA mismatch repair endonuclease MutL [Candidatus Peregrinibacteria bacterium]|nr:MAG: DNA mismatch repair endonuclease MutL [Candidatus Peregrinibacteria bacterium]